MKTHQAWIICVLLLIIGFFFGNNYGVDFLKIRAEGIALDQLLTIIATVGIGWYIPSRLSKVLEDKRVIKNLLVEEISSFLKFIIEIKKKLSECYVAGTITADEKLQINLLFEELDLLLNNLQTQTEVIDKELCNDSVMAYLSYHRTVTGGALMNATYSLVDQAFYSSVVTEHYKLDITFKKLAQKVQLHS